MEEKTLPVHPPTKLPFFHPPKNILPPTYPLFLDHNLKKLGIFHPSCLCVVNEEEVSNPNPYHSVARINPWQTVNGHHVTRQSQFTKGILGMQRQGARPVPAVATDNDPNVTTGNNPFRHWLQI